MNTEFDKDEEWRHLNARCLEIAGDIMLGGPLDGSLRRAVYARWKREQLLDSMMICGRCGVFVSEGCFDFETPALLCGSCGEANG